MSGPPVFATLVLDGVGIGAQADADRYGDAGSNTLAHVCAAAHPKLPHLTQLGLGCIASLEGMPSIENPRADFGRMRETSAGKDSTTGHWELAGLQLDRPFPTYPQGFPDDVVTSFLHKTGLDGILGNRPASGTQIIAELGVDHQRTGWPIVYTSADSVFQVAAHVETISLEALYHICRVARDEVCIGEHAVGRVIARPFRGAPGAYVRISEKRKDFALPPPAPPLQQTLQQHGITTCAIGKIADLFAGVGFDEIVKTRSNADGIEQIRAALHRFSQQDRPAFIWINLVDFDQEYGHRNDVSGFAAALEVFDQALPSLLDALPPGGRLLITADHGNDPTFPGTDHTREYVPLLVYPAATGTGRTLGLRSTFADHAVLVSSYFGVPSPSSNNKTMPETNPKSSSARKAWEGIVQTPELVGYFEGLFNKLGIQVGEGEEQFTVIHRGQAVEFVEGLESEVDYTVTLKQENVDNLIAHAADGRIDEEESWQIIRVLFTPMTEATLKSPVLSSSWLRKLAGVEDRIHVHLLDPTGGDAATHSLIYAQGRWEVKAGLHGQAQRTYRLTPDQALDYQRRLFEAVQKNSTTGWISFTRWYKSWREQVSTTD